MPDVFCVCPCHAVMRGDLYAAWHAGDADTVARLSNDPAINFPAWVDIRDPLEAAVASGCPCVRNHTPALLAAKPPPKYLPPRPWRPEDGD